MGYLVLFTIAYGLSILTLTFFPFLALWVGIFFIGLIVLARSPRRRIKLLVFLSVYIFGCLYVDFRINVREKKDIPPFTGVIMRDVGESEEKKEFLLKSPKGNYYKLTIPSSSQLSPGDRILVPRVFQPPSSGTPGVFDYNWYLRAQGISGIIQLRNDSDIIRTGDNSLNFYQRSLISLRRHLLESTTIGMPKDTAALLRGIVVGEKREISPLVRKMFADTGVMHILAVSGLNVALVATFFYFIMRKLFRFGKKSTSFLLIFILCIYGQIVGTQASVQRAVIMAIAGLTAIIIERDKEMLNSVGLAALILLLMWPLQLFDVGFQLSFGATIGLILITPPVQRILKKLGKFVSAGLATTLGAQLAIMPITIYYFHTFSVISFLANLVVVPLVAVITVLGFISFLLSVCFQPLAGFLIWCNHILLKTLILLVELFHRVPFAFLYVAFPGFLTVVCYYLLLWGMVKKWRWQRFAIGGAGVCGILVFSSIFLPRSLTVSFLDVKQGDSIVIRTPENKTILLDGGGGLDADYSIGETLIVPYLRNQGISHIDTLILSHVHYNHIQGLLAVIERFPVRRVLIPRLLDNDFHQEYVREFLYMLKEKKICLQEWNELRDIYRESDVHVENVIYNKSKTGTPDDRSLIVKVRYKNKSFLLTSDNRSVPDITSDVCQIPRHGKVPCTALPSAEIYVVSSKVIPADEKILSTARDGTIVFSTDGQRLKVKMHR